MVINDSHSLYPLFKRGHISVDYYRNSYTHLNATIKTKNTSALYTKSILTKRNNLDPQFSLIFSKFNTKQQHNMYSDTTPAQEWTLLDALEGHQ